MRHPHTMAVMFSTCGYVYDPFVMAGSGTYHLTAKSNSVSTPLPLTEKRNVLSLQIHVKVVAAGSQLLVQFVGGRRFAGCTRI